MTSPPTPQQSKPKETGIPRIVNAFGYSMAGLHAAFSGEAAFRQIVALVAVLLPVACVLDVTRAERALLMAVLLIALIIELLNSAIEAAIDRISLERHPLSKRAKDMGSAAVLLTLCMVALVWFSVLLL